MKYKIPSATFKSAFENVKTLVDDFKANEQYYLSTNYSESEVREDYINKFFIALGWDVSHQVQKNPYEQEVKVEKGVKVGKAQKRADYAFHLDPNFRDPVFFVEAKKPARELSNADDYFQAIRYGWNANTPIVILTDFEEFHIIDSRFKPDINGTFNKKLKKFHYSEYANKEKFAEIYYLFSREEVGNNSIEKFSESLPKPRGKAVQWQLFPGGHQSIDESFLEEIDEIRISLARTFKKSNPALQSDELTEATHRTIDRLVFIRFLEDKLIEQQHYISEFGESSDAWDDFVALCKRLDVKYNGVVFKHHFIDSPNFNKPKDVFGNICEDISHLNSPYDFNMIPIHILGSIYERFLGKVVHATPKRVTIEEKPEVKKAGGVYYTPQYIVRYIVANTIGKLIEGKTPLQISRLRFADISCGSGSFLITVFETLLDYHNNWYQNNPTKAKNDGCYHQDGKWVLSLQQKKKILLNNIYGVDIDSQAVEVTQLSLCLKLMEDETTATTNEMQVLFHEQILPDLTKNIVCGNSLIGWDIEDGQLFPEKEIRTLNPMDFKNTFNEILKNGGFDTIVGNPPYYSLSTLRSIQQNYYNNKFSNSGKTGDIYCLFIEKALELLKEKGNFSFITSNQWLQTNYGKTLRNYLVNNGNPQLLINFGGNKIFKGATVDTSILIVKKEKCKQNLIATHFKTDYVLGANIDNYVNKNKVVLKNLNIDRWIIADNSSLSLINKINNTGEKLSKRKICINRGLLTGINKAFIINNTIKNRLCKEDKNSKEIIKPILRGRDVHRYSYKWANLWILLTKNGIDIKSYKAIYNHLNSFGEAIRKRSDQGENWWNLRSCSYYEDFEKEKIIYPETTVRRSEFVLDRDKMIVDKTCFIITGEDLIFLNGILASRLMEWYLESELRLLGKTSIQYSKQFINEIPIPNIDFSKITDTAIHGKIVSLVENMIKTKKKLNISTTDRDKNYYMRRITSINNKINKEVYKLYNLTKDEIYMVTDLIK